jgi:hypothetical protein
MPRFYFDVHDGVSKIDTEGTVLADIAHARVYAATMAGKLGLSDATRSWSGEKWTLSVRDEEGFVLFSIVFVVTEPAVAAEAQRA